MNLQDYVGLFLIIIGLLVKRFPNLIAGYHTLPPEEKARVNINGLSILMRNTFIVMGILMIVSNQISQFMAFQDYQIAVIITVVIFFTLFLFVLLHFHINDNNLEVSSRFREIKRNIILLLLFVSPILLVLTDL